MGLTPARRKRSNHTGSRFSTSSLSSLPSVRNLTLFLAPLLPGVSALKSLPMRDRLTKERRSWNMSRIRGKNTSPEMAVRRLLHRMGYRFRLHVRIAIPPEGARESHESTRKDLNRSQRREQRIRREEPANHANHAKSSHGHAESKKDLNRTQRRKQRSGGSFSQPSRPLRSSVQIVSRNRLIRSVCPDIVLPKYKTVIFVHGCFWHRHRGCKSCTTPTNLHVTTL